MRPARRVVEGESLHPVPQLSQRRGSRGSGQTGADHDHAEPAAVRRVHQPDAEPVVVPLVLDGTFWDLGVEYFAHAGTHPAKTATGRLTFPTTMKAANP